MPILVLFQDEARFGRMSDPARCWAPYPMRPIVQLALVREFRYFYAAIGPQKRGGAGILSSGISGSSAETTRA